MSESRVCVMCNGTGRDRIAVTERVNGTDRVVGHREIDAPCRCCRGRGIE